MDNMANLKDFVRNGKKIVAAAINYKSVVIERKIPVPKKPVIFLKPTSSYITPGQKIRIPEGWNVAQETELGVIIGRTCQKVKACDAMKYVGGYCLALDMTALSELTPARQKGLPWTTAKAFDTACAVSRFLSRQEIKDPHNVDIWCRVNGDMKQQSNTSDLLFNIPQLISYTSESMTLEPNDLILTGTPLGDCAVTSGDHIKSAIANTDARKHGLPWTIGKSFDTACPVSRFIDLQEIKDPHNLEIWCKVNGEIRQQANTNDLIFNIPNLISCISETMTLEPNDLVLTGTSTGVLPVKTGDVIESGIKDLVEMEFQVE